jgi:peroxiredoxin
VSISVIDFQNFNLFGLVGRFVRRTPLATIPPGETAPVIVLKDLDGKKVSLAARWKKGPVLAAFFKVNCVTSQLTFPFLQRIYEMYGGSNFTLWGFSQNHPKDTKLFIRKFGIQFPILSMVKAILFRTGTAWRTLRLCS